MRIVLYAEGGDKEIQPFFPPFLRKSWLRPVVCAIPNCSHTLFYCVREQSILGSHSVHGYMVLSLLAHGSCLCSTHVLVPDKCLSSSSKQWTFFAPVGRRVALWFGATHVIAPKEVILIFGFRQEEVRNAMVVQCLVR